MNMAKQRTPSVLGLAALALMMCSASLAWAEDHQNEDIFLFTDTEWTGDHINIRKLTIDTNAVLRATPGTQLRIQADTIEVRGHLSADLAGHAGGAPGGRGRGGVQGMGPGAGSVGVAGSVCGRPGIDYNAGGGGAGAASYIGGGGVGGWGADANDGGCQGSQGGSGGATTNVFTDLRLGSGGGGGGGAGGARQQPGTAGQAGGGYLILEAKTLIIQGRVSSNGGRGGQGGTSPDFFHGGGGGGGASGGAILIRTTYLMGQGSIEANGGDGGNGGQGDRIGDALFNGAGGGGGGGGLISLDYSNAEGFVLEGVNSQCVARGGQAGQGANTNGQAGLPGMPGRCITRRVNGQPTAKPGGPYITVEGQPLRLNASQSTDPDNDPLSYAWDCDGDANFEAIGQEVTCTFPNDGTYNVALRVEDGNGGFDTEVTPVVVTEGPPLGALVGPERVDEGSTVTLDASGSTGFGDQIVSYAWDFDYDGTFVADETGSSPSIERLFCDNGAFTVAVQVTDDGGSTSLALHRVVVTNLPPTITSTPGTMAVEGQPYTYTLQVQDPGCDTLSYQITRRPDGMSVDGEGNLSFTPNFRQAQEGSVSVRLLVSDDDFGRQAQEWEIAIQFADNDADSLPDTWELFFGLNPSDAGDAMEDPDGDGRDNVEEFQNETNPTEFDGPTQVRLSAPRGGSEVDSVTPVLTSFKATSAVGAPLTYDFEIYQEVSDPSMLQPELRITEMVGVTAQENSASVSWTVPQSAGLEDHSSYCWRSRAVDDRVPGPWSELWCFFVNLANEAPTAPQTLLPEDGTQVSSGTPTLVVGNCSDPDGDPLAYTFILYAGEGVSAPVDSISSLPGGEDGMTRWQVGVELEENQRYCWRSQCRDNEGQTSSYTPFSCFFVNRSNDLPEAPVILAPGPDAEGKRATLTTDAVDIVVRNSVDPDGDALAYVFQLDTDINFNTPDLVEDELPEGELGETIWEPQTAWKDNTVYYVRVRASDGLGSSTYAVGEFFLNFENDPPTAPSLRSPVGNLLITSRQPWLTVVNAMDPDGDTLRYEIVVYRDAEATDVVDQRAGITETPDFTQHRVVTTQLENGTYYWRARANDGQSDGPWSELGSFVVQGEQVVDGVNNGDGPDPTPPVASKEGCASVPGQAPGPWSLLLLAALSAFWLRRRS